MTIITRMTRLFTADLHCVLDHIEEPETLLRQAIREMQTSLESAETNLATSQQRMQALDNRIVALKQSLNDIDSQLDLCFESNEDELARGLVKRKLECSRLEKRLNAQKSTLQQSIIQQQEAFVQNQQSLAQLRQKADALNTNATGDTHNYKSTDSIMTCVDGINVSDADIDVAFLQEKKSRGAS